MSLHSSYSDYSDYQVSNIFFNDLRRTTPSRLKYFFVPDLDYNGYVHVVKDQEHSKLQKDYRRNQLSACRQEQLQKNRIRQNRREEFEASLKPSKKGGFPTQLVEKPKPKRTRMQRWADQRKRDNDAKAAKMIEARVEQEAGQQQMYNGWKAATKDSIRNKFRENALINRQVEQQLVLPHTYNQGSRSHTSLGFSHQPDLGVTAHKEWEAPASESPVSEAPVITPLMSPADVNEADRQVAELSANDDGSTMTILRSSPVSSKQLELDPSVHEVEAFDSSIGTRRVLSSQRLRSLSLDTTKDWTRPGRSESSCR
eukprot:TRINITY_DN11150_c0_g1_i3.p1 TRINITY_DN11150_c0_g1~~TRINITY_DN11150_c0_g1_i3.p1  ORF type:complete len:313 (-),score=72.79 TRINITY_DN11150_c0_g1_i3:256-1194(-)